MHILSARTTRRVFWPATVVLLGYLGAVQVLSALQESNIADEPGGELDGLVGNIRFLQRGEDLDGAEVSEKHDGRGPKDPARRAGGKDVHVERSALPLGDWGAFGGRGARAKGDIAAPTL